MDSIIIRPVVWITFRRFWQGDKIILAWKWADGSLVHPTQAVGCSQCWTAREWPATSV